MIAAVHGQNVLQLVLKDPALADIPRAEEAQPILQHQPDALRRSAALLLPPGGPAEQLGDQGAQHTAAQNGRQNLIDIHGSPSFTPPRPHEHPRRACPR